MLLCLVLIGSVVPRECATWYTKSTEYFPRITETVDPIQCNPIQFPWILWLIRIGLDVLRFLVVQNRSKNRTNPLFNYKNNFKLSPPPQLPSRINHYKSSHHDFVLLSHKLASLIDFFNSCPDNDPSTSVEHAKTATAGLHPFILFYP